MHVSVMSQSLSWYPAEVPIVQHLISKIYNLLFSGYWVPQISNSDFSASIITGQTRAKSYLFVKSKQVFTFFFHSYTPTKSVTDSVKEPMKKARKVQKEVERP